MSGFELITITFSFVVGLGMAQLLRSLGFVVRERETISWHWVPLFTAALILFFQVQFWFGLWVINNELEVWTWSEYGLVFVVAGLIFLAGATVFAPPGSDMDRDLLEDFRHRGRISLLFLAAYLVGWMGLGLMFWRPEFWLLMVVNGSLAALLCVAYAARRGMVPLYVLIAAVTVFGSITVWTRPDLILPMPDPMPLM
jgi:hypothetical protein